MAIYDGNDWMIGWTSNWDGREPTMEVGPWPDLTRWSNKYHLTSGCCFTAFRGMDEEEQARRLLNEAANLMFQGVPAEMVLREFAKIRVWCQMRVRLIPGDYLAFLPSLGYEKWNPWSGE